MEEKSLIVKIELPTFLEPKISKIDNISFCNYVQKEPQNKNEIYITSNILISVRKGIKVLHLGKQSIEVDKDSLLFLRSGSYIMTEVLDEYYEAMLFIYEDELLLDFINKYDISFDKNDFKEQDIFKIDSSYELESLINSTCNYFANNTKNKEELIKLKLEEAFLNILSSSSKDKFMDLLASIYKSNYFKSEVEKSFSFQDNILDLAYKFKIPEASFRKKFKESFNTTPKKWQTSKRLGKAKVLLETTNMNVNEVCIESGFENLSWFIQTFKKQYTKTPKQIKNNKN